MHKVSPLLNSLSKNLMTSASEVCSTDIPNIKLKVIKVLADFFFKAVLAASGFTNNCCLFIKYHDTILGVWGQAYNICLVCCF